jgi:hypothetical protein
VARLAVFLKDRLDVFVEAEAGGVCGQGNTSPDAAHEYYRPKDPGNHLASFKKNPMNASATRLMILRPHGRAGSFLICPAEGWTSSVSQSSASRREKMCPQSSQRRWINGGVPDCPTIRVCRPPHFVQM